MYKRGNAVIFSKEEVKKALGNTKVYTYLDLYYKLGVEKLLEENNRYDVKNIFMNTKLNQYCYDVLMNRNLHRKAGIYGMCKKKIIISMVAMDHCNYSPVDIDELNGLMVIVE